MKINKLFMAALAAGTLLASCTSEEEVGKNAPGKETYAGFTISMSSQQGTRAENDAVGTAGEKAVNKIGIYIWDEAAATLHSKVLNVADFTKSGNTYTATTAVKTTTGTKDIVIVANPTAAVEGKIAAMRGGILNASGFNVAQADFYTLESGNVTSMVISGVKKSQAVGQQTADEAIAAGAAIEVDIYRNLAKVVVQLAKDYEVVGGTVNNVQFGLVSTAKDAHFLKQTNTLYYAAPTGSDLDDAGDSYYTNFNSPIMGSGTYKNVAAAVADNTPGEDGFYCFENTPQNFRNGNTTAARIKSTFDPDETNPTVKVVTGYSSTTGVETTGTINAGTSFYVRKLDGSYWSETAYTAAQQTGDHKIEASNFSAKYENGVGYYTIPVMDDAKVKGVERNAFYQLLIEKVLGPGSPEENTTDVTDPYADDTFLSVKVNVKAWNFLSSGHIIQ